MNRLRLRLVGLVVLILAVIIGVYTLRLAESPPAEQVETQEETVSKPQANTGQPKTNADAAAERAVLPRASEFEKRKAAWMTRMADSLKTLYRNPGRPEAAKARRSLLRLPEGLARSGPGTAAEREAISRFLNKSGVPQRAELAPNSPDRWATTAAGPYSQPSGRPQVENSQEPSRADMKDHLKTYKATRNELFPMYQGNLPTGLITYLPGPYRQQVIKGKAQQGLSNPGGFKPGASGKPSSGSSKPNSKKSSPVSTKKAVKSFKSFTVSATRKPSTTSKPVGSR